MHRVARNGKYNKCTTTAGNPYNKKDNLEKKTYKIKLYLAVMQAYVVKCRPKIET